MLVKVSSSLMITLLILSQFISKLCSHLCSVFARIFSTGSGNFDLVTIFSINFFKQEVKISSLPPKRAEYVEESSTNEEPRLVDGPGRPNIFEKPDEKMTGKRIMDSTVKYSAAF